ncbi:MULTISPECIES: LamG-like jellyroll fold domain-containing protein [unclassified Beijerinckia]|uniref:LamG-like jellyroll fold domain-containing protein n=1 Tax=unclassified Beijerinckia TaxID=2638183 RepID=UPI000896822A|nr:MULTISPECIES: LamG-like jellyroll fold domain-containing protein [unclassified Beijerinckia]MDH7794136.1 hypothetical protein [Beijerinckia sp. GAS462]SEB54083.1 Concanavalin A-like lectin/glucanases superfamily protein [Beijerinckia sp. 28-YEA-48]
MADLAPQLLAAMKGDKGLYPDGVFTLIKSYRKDSIVKWDGSQWRALQLVPAGTMPVVGAYWERWIDGTPVADAAQVASDRVLSQAAAATASAAMDSVSALALQVAGYTSAAQIAAQSAAAVSGLANLSAALRAILLDPNTVAVHVYDTRRDADGGGWVRVLNNSIINEPLNTATRGSRRDLPTLIYVVVTSTAVNILDGDDPSAPMWAIWQALGAGATTNFFSGGGLSGGTVSVTACQGAIGIGHSAYGLWIIDLISERCSRVVAGSSAVVGLYLGNLADRNAGKGFDGVNGLHFEGTRIALTSFNVNHVAMTVIPQTLPNSNRFGLPNPTIFVATESGTNVIRPDGTVVNSVNTGQVKRVAITDDSTLYMKFGGGDTSLIMIPYPNYLTASFTGTLLSAGTVPATMYNLWRVGNNGAMVPLSNGRVAFAANTSGGISIFDRDKGSIVRSLVTYIDDYRNSGWLPTGIKAAFAESTKVSAQLTGATIFFDYFSDNDASDWSSTFGAVISGVGGELSVAVGSMSATNYARKTISGFTIGQSYAVIFKYRTDGTHGARFSVFDGVNTSLGLATGATSSVTYVTGRLSFTAVSTSVELRCIVDHPTPTMGAKTSFGDIVVKEVVGDRSVARIDLPGNFAELAGSVNRAAVAVGAELACYSNLNASNGYLFVTNTGGMFNVGTGDFCAAVWFLRTNGAASESIFHFTDQAGGASDGRGLNTNWNLYIPNTGVVTCATRDQAGVIGGGVITDSLVVGAWSFIVMQKRGTRLECYVNGRLAGFWSVSGNLTNSAANLLIGAMFYNGVVGYRPQGSIALPRVSIGSAPSSDQIVAMYRDEIGLFQPNAKCLLQGGYVVQDLSRDRDTDLLYVAKSIGGTDVFQGLVNKGTILSTASSNLIPGSGRLACWTTTSGSSIGVPVASNINWGSGKLLPLIETSANVAHYIAVENVTIPNVVCAMIIPIKSAGRGLAWVSSTAIPASFWVNLATGALSNLAGCTALPTIDLGNGIMGVQVNVTGNGVLGSIRTGASTIVNATIYAGVDGQTATLVGDPVIRTGAAAFTANDFVPSLSRSDNHKFVSAHDGNVLIGTAAGADIIMPALPLRSGVRARRAVASYDPNFSEFDGRGTSDVTPTYLGNPFYVPEGGKVHFHININGMVPGGTATDRATRPVVGYAYRNVGDANATVVIPTGGIPIDKTSGTMDAGVVAGSGGWVYPYGSGKAATQLEWFGNQRLKRGAA